MIPLDVALDSLAWLITALAVTFAYGIMGPIGSFAFRRGLLGRTRADALRVILRLGTTYVVFSYMIAAFGLEIAGSLALLVVSAGAAVGLAAEGTASNLISGLILRSRHLFEVGDYVQIAGQRGRVVLMDNLSVVVETVDLDQVSIPWKNISQDVIINESSDFRCNLRPLEVPVPIYGIVAQREVDRVLAGLESVADRLQRMAVVNMTREQRDCYDRLRNEIGYPYVSFRGWGEQYRDFRIFFISPYQDDRALDRHASTIRLALDEVVLQLGYQPVADDALSGEIAIRS